MKHFNALFLFMLILCIALPSSAEVRYREGMLAYAGRDEELLRDSDIERAKQLGLEVNEQERKQDQYVYFDNLTTALVALNGGQIKRLMLIRPTCDYIMNMNPNYVYTKSRTRSEALAMAVRAQDTELLEALNGAIESMRKDGTIDALFEKYTSSSSDRAESDAPSMRKTEGAQLRVVVTGDLPPIDYTDETGAPNGFNIAFLAEIGARTGRHVELVSADAGSRAIALTSGRADAIFWMRGVLIKGGEEADYSAECSGDIAITIPYLQVERGRLELKE